MPRRPKRPDPATPPSPGPDRRLPFPGPAAERWDLVERVLADHRVRTVYLWGPPGTGKTYAAYHLGRIDPEPFAVTLTEDTAAAELRGHWVTTERGMRWHDGPFTAAMRAGVRLVVNEVTHGAPEALSLLHPVLEAPETARLTLPNDETVRPSEGFHVVVTDNLPPTDLPDALRDRFDCVLEVRDPSPAALAALRPALRRAAQRAMALEPERFLGLRAWFTIQRLEDAYGLEHACVLALGPERGPLVHDAIVLGESAQGEDPPAAAEGA